MTAALLRATKDHQSRVQIAAVRALGQLGDVTALDRLIELAGDQQSAGLRQAACEALGRLALPEAVPVLLAALPAEDVTVRLAAMMSLANSGRAGHDALLTAWQNNAEDVNVPLFMQAFAATGHLDHLKIFREVIHHEQSSVAHKNAAAQAIATFAAEIAVPELVHALQQGVLPADKVIPLLLTRDHSIAVPAVCRLLSHPTAAPVVTDHLKTLHADALPFLHQFFADQDQDARGRIRAFDLIIAITEQAERASGFGDVAVVANAHRLPDKYDRLTIVLRDHPTLIDQLLPRLADRDQLVRFAVAKLFVWQGLEPGVYPLVSMITEPSQELLKKEQHNNEQFKINRTNAELWRAIARYTQEINRRQLVQQVNSLPTVLSSLAELAEDIILTAHSVDQVEIANNRRRSQGEREQARAELQYLVSMQSDAIQVAGAILQAGSPDTAVLRSAVVAENILHWAIQDSWPKNPRNFRHLGATAARHIRAWKTSELQQIVWQHYQQTSSLSAIPVLGSLAVVEAVPSLIAATKKHKDRRVTIAAMQSLHQIAQYDDEISGNSSLKQQVSDAIAEVLQQTPPERQMIKRQINEFAQVGIPVLRQLAVPSAVPTLINLIKQPDHPNFPHGYGAATAGQAANALAHLSHESGPQAIVRLLADPSLDVAKKESDLAPAIAQSNNPVLIRALLQLMADHPLPSSVQTFDAGFYAADLLGTIGVDALALIEESINRQSANALFSQRLARSLALIADPQSVPLLAHLLDHPQPEVVMQALVSLGQLNQPAALEALRRFAATPSNNADIRQTVAWAMAQYQ